VQRINEAIHTAQAGATTAIEAERQRFAELIDDAGGSLTVALGLTESKPG